MNKNQVIDFLKANNFVPSKRMGQNFLLNMHLKQKIVALSEINANDNVIEIGPGLGALTEFILPLTENFLAIELDKRLCAFLRKTYPKLELINNDILQTDISKICTAKNWNKIKVISNLPYSVSSKVILQLIQIPQISNVSILVQKEMAERLTAKPNTKDYNAFTVLVALYCDVKVQLKIGPQEFHPIPAVESWFIAIKIHNENNINFHDIDLFLRQAFLARRKKLVNNLKYKYDQVSIEKSFEHLHLDINVRAENLMPTQFIELHKHLEKNKDVKN